MLMSNLCAESSRRLLKILKAEDRRSTSKGPVHASHQNVG